MKHIYLFAILLAACGGVYSEPGATIEQSPASSATASSATDESNGCICVVMLGGGAGHSACETHGKGAGACCPNWTKSGTAKEFRDAQCSCAVFGSFQLPCSEL